MKEKCCLCLTTTIVPTTTPLTCASFTCVAPWIPEPEASTFVCAATGCTKEKCCLCLTTTLLPTTTPMPTTTELTCASFTCIAPWIADPGKTHRACADFLGGCTKHSCCLCLTTTPMATSTQPCDTNAPPAVASPCTTKAIRLYSAQQIPGVSENAPEKFSTAQGTTVGFLTIFAVAGLSAGLGVSIFKHVRRNYRRTGVPTQVDSLEDGAD